MLKKEKSDFDVLPKHLKYALIVSFIFYILYFISASVNPISMFLRIPDPLLITVEKLLNFTPAILGFAFCISIISISIIFTSFNKKKTREKIFLLEGVSFVLYFIIPIISTTFVLILLVTGISTHIPNPRQISNFLESLIYLNFVLFVISAFMNITLYRIFSFERDIKGIKS